MRRRDFLRALRGTPAAFLVAKYGVPNPDPTAGRVCTMTWQLDDQLLADKIMWALSYGTPNLQRMALAK